MNIVKWFGRWPVEQRASLTAIVLGSLIFLPYLGAVGLWDPWETHYGEVAREMVERDDFIHPHWEKDWFFSKPALTMWLQAVGMVLASRGPAVTLIIGLVLLAHGAFFVRRVGVLIQFWSVLSLFVGTLSMVLGVWATQISLPWKFGNLVEDQGALPVLFEWGFRLPSTSFSIVALGLLAWALTRVVNARMALATVTVLATMPLYFLLSRQAVTDPPLVSATISGVACALVGLFDVRSERRHLWWYGAWFFFALATLAKGWLGFLVPGAVLAGYIALFVTDLVDLRASARWVKVERGASLTWGLVVGLGVGVIASRIGLARETIFISGREINGSLDTLSTAANWLGLTWGLLAAWVTVTVLARRRPVTGASVPKLIALLSELRLGTGVLVFLLVSLPWYYEMFTFQAYDDEHKHFWLRFIVHDHLSRFFSGVYTSTPGGTFTYFIEQAGYAVFPWVLLLPGAAGVIGRIRLREPRTADRLAGISLFWLIISWFAVGDSATKFHHYVFVTLPPMAVLIGLFIDEVWEQGIDAHLAALIAGVPLFLLVGKDLWANPKSFTDLFVFNYDRPYPDFLVTHPVLSHWAIKDLLKLGSLASLATLVACTAFRAKRALFATAAVGALAFALWFSWSHWVDLSPQWSQRDQFWRYYTQRQLANPLPPS